MSWSLLPPVFFQEFYDFRSYVKIFIPFLVNFYISCKIIVDFYSLACGCPGYPRPFIEETVHSPLYVLVSFVIRSLTIYAWVYFWALFSIPSICVSAFMPVLNYFDNYNFVIQFETRAHDAFSFVLLSQDCFGYLGYFVVPYKFQDYLFNFCEKCP